MSSESDSVVTGPLLKHARHRGALASHVRVIVVMLAAVAAQLALVAAFTGAMSKPTLQDVTVGIVVPVGSNSAAVASAIAPIPGSPIERFPTPQLHKPQWTTATYPRRWWLMTPGRRCTWPAPSGRH